jgi:hypothetical protein
VFKALGIAQRASKLENSKNRLGLVNLAARAANGEILKLANYNSKRKEKILGR